MKTTLIFLKLKKYENNIIFLKVGAVLSIIVEAQCCAKTRHTLTLMARRCSPNCSQPCLEECYFWRDAPESGSIQNSNQFLVGRF